MILIEGKGGFLSRGTGNDGEGKSVSRGRGRGAAMEEQVAEASGRAS